MAKTWLARVFVVGVVVLVAALGLAPGQTQQAQPSQPTEEDVNAPKTAARTYARCADLSKVAGESVWVHGIAGNRVDTRSRTTKVYWLHDQWGASVRVRTEQDWPTNGVHYEVRGIVFRDPEFNDYVLNEQERQEWGTKPLPPVAAAPVKKLDPLVIAGIGLIALAVLLGALLVWQTQKRKRALSEETFVRPYPQREPTPADLTLETWAKVEVVRGPDAGKTFLLVSRESTVGRESGDVRLSDQSVSRDHGKIMQTVDGRILYIDDSRNGSRVNGEAVHKTQKAIGDEAEIEVGTSLLKFTNLRRAAPAGGERETRIEPAPVVDKARAPTMISLGAEVKVLEAPDAGKTFPLSKTVTTIGRQPDRDIQLTDEYASRKHATIFLENGKFLLRNESSQGTSVNDGAVQEQELTGGERIKMGRTVLKFVKE